MDFKDTEELNAEILRRVADYREDVESENPDREAFMLAMVDWMTQSGGWSGGTVFEFARRGIHVSGYAWDGEDPGAIEVFVAEYVPGMPSRTLSVADANAHLDRGAAFVRGALEKEGFSGKLECGQARDLALVLESGKSEWDTIRIVLVTNARFLSNVKAQGFSRNPEQVGNARLEFRVWDLDRMFRVLQAGKGHEPISLDFGQEFGAVIPCLEIPRSTEEYSACLAVFPGDVLADIYEKFGTQLLEKNVRVFLQDRGKVNRGILQTIERLPQRFLAYNNGVSITAREISFGEDASGQRTLGKLVDFQIVNGGQTTASLHNARKKHRLDLSRTFVQAKISVVGNGADEDALVRDITLYANSQNRIKKSDLGADGAFHRALETLSRMTWAPDGRSKWFYERANGQYEVARQHAGNVRGGRQQFEREYPKRQRIQKTDVAKVVLAWQGVPEVASLGGEKCFQKFSLGLREGFVPDETYFKTLIAQTILFRETDAIVRKQGDTAYKANVVAYTVALLNFKAQNRLDLLAIWDAQGVPEALAEWLDVAVGKVRQTIVKTAAGGNVTEWGKKTKCWEAVQEIEIDTPPMGSRRSFAPVAGPVAMVPDETPEELEARSRAGGISATGWLAIAQWGRTTGNLAEWYIKFAGSIAVWMNGSRRLSIKQVKKCCEILDILERCGVNPATLA